MNLTEKRMTALDALEYELALLQEALENCYDINDEPLRLCENRRIVLLDKIDSLSKSIQWFKTLMNIA